MLSLSIRIQRLLPETAATIRSPCRIMAGIPRSMYASHKQSVHRFLFFGTISTPAEYHPCVTITLVALVVNRRNLHSEIVSLKNVIRDTHLSNNHGKRSPAAAGDPFLS